MGTFPASAMLTHTPIKLHRQSQQHSSISRLLIPPHAADHARAAAGTDLLITLMSKLQETSPEYTEE